MRKHNGRADMSGIEFKIADRTAGANPVQRSAHDRGAIERQLRRTMHTDRGSALLRRLLSQTNFRPVNIHLMTNEDVLRALTRLVSVGEIHVTPTRWWSRSTGTGTGTGEATARMTQAAATGGRAIKSSSDDAADRRDRRMRDGGNPTDRDPADRPFPPASQQQPEPKNWIEFHLVDHETEEPIANVPFKISMPDGSVAEHTSDGNGMIRIADLEPGYCDIREIQDRAAFEVVGIV